MTWLVLMILYSHIHTANAQTTLNFGQSYFDSLNVGTPVCGDLHVFRDESQVEYLNFKNNLPSRIKSRGTWDPAAVFECGSFTVYYHDFVDSDGTPSGGGFADPLLGEARRNTLCAVLTYVENVLAIHPNANPVIEVLDSYYGPGNPALFATGWLAQASSYYPTIFGNTQGIYDGHFSNHIRLGIDPDNGMDYDAFLKVNFHETNIYTPTPIEYFNYLDPLINVNKYDLFTVLLHEVTHMLGFVSAMGEDFFNQSLICKNAGNSYTRFDWHFGFYENILNLNAFNNHKLLIGSISTPSVNPNINSLSFPLRRANVWINNEGPPMNHNLFAGIPNLPLEFSVGLEPSFLSHLGTLYQAFPNRQQFSPGKYMAYVMEPSLHRQNLRREWTLPELRMILDLGYSLNSLYGLQTSMSPPYLNIDVIQNSPPYRSDYNVLNSMLVPILNIEGGSVDLNVFAETKPAQFEILNSNTDVLPNISSLTINLVADNTIADLDNDDILTKQEFIFGIRGVSDGLGNNHNRVSLDPTGKIFTFTPAPGYYGRAEFGFFLWDEKEVGAMKIYTINVLRDANLTYPQEQELVINGSFEDGLEIKTWEEPFKIYSTHDNVNAQSQLNFGNLGSGGGHIYGIEDRILVEHSLDNFPDYAIYGVDFQFGNFGAWLTACPQGFVAPTPSPDIANANNNRYAQQGGIISSLISPMVEGEYYTLTFKYIAVVPTSLGLSLGYQPFYPGEVVDIGFEIIASPTSSTAYSVLQTIGNQITIQSLTPWNLPSLWNTGTIEFQYCGADPAFYIRSLPLSNNKILYVDDLSLKVNPSPSPISVSAGPDQYISDQCTEATFNVNVTSESCAMSYQWSPSVGLSDPSILNPTAAPTVTTTYTITVTDLITGQTASDDVTVFVFSNPSNNGPITMCYTDPPIDLTNHVSITGGEFYVQYNGQTLLENNIFDPADFVSSTFNTVYTITYILGEAPCLSSTAFIITVQGNTSNATHPNGLNATTGTTTLTGNLQFLEDLTIQFGATVTINGGATVQFAEGKGIVIMPGGKLNVVSNSLLTNIGCDSHWMGIRVGGNPSFSQWGSEANQQGLLNLRNSEVRNAIIGAANYLINTSTTGGRIFTLGATFKNCRRAVHLQNYANIHPTTGAILPIKCEFYNSNFIWDENFQFINETSNPMMGLSSVHRVAILGCKFTNTNTGLFAFPNNHPNKCAILGRSASIVLSRGCSGEPPYAIDQNGNCASGNVASTIEGFNYGVYLVEGSLSSITNTTFRCYRGLWDFSSNVIQITQNTFTQLPAALLPYMTPEPSQFNPVWNVPYGVYLQGSTGFWVEGNTFTYPGTSSEAGLFVINSGPDYNQIYRNTFHSTSIGIMAYDANRGLNGNSGLKLECNNFNQNSHGMVVRPSITGQVPVGWGISHTQGNPGQPGFSSFPAGNSFNSTNVSVRNNLDPITYCIQTNEIIPPVNGIVNLFTVLEENLCPSSFGGVLVEKGVQASNYQSSADSISNVLDAIIDAGNTQMLTNEVILADYSQALELYYQLMQVSPNLSEDVLVEAIKKEFDLPASLLTLILSSNPHVAKSGRLQRELDERILPLDEYQRDMINQGLQLVSHKERLEARENHLRTRTSALVNQIILESLDDSTLVIQSLLESLALSFPSVDKYQLISEQYLNIGNTVSAGNWLSSIADEFNLDTRQSAEHADFITIRSIITNTTATGDSILSPANIATLEQISFKHGSRAALLAELILSEYTGQLLLETLVEPNDESKSIKSKKPTVSSTGGKRSKVFPNPSSGIFIVDIPREWSEIIISVLDQAGKVVYNIHSTNIDVTNIDLRHLASGSYNLLVVSTEFGSKESHHIQIMK
jgi:hypothetical protein